MRIIGLLTLMFTLTACHVTKQEILDEQKREEGRKQERDRYEAEKPKKSGFSLEQDLGFRITPISGNFGRYLLTFSWSQHKGYWITLYEDHEFTNTQVDITAEESITYPCKSNQQMNFTVSSYFDNEKIEDKKYVIKCPSDIAIPRGPDPTNLQKAMVFREDANNIGRLVLEPNSTLIIDETFSELSIQSLRFTQGSKIRLLNSNPNSKPLKIKIGTIIGTPHFESYGKNGENGRNGIDTVGAGHPYLVATQRQSAGQWVGARGADGEVVGIPCPNMMDHVSNDPKPGDSSIRLIRRNCGYQCTRRPTNGGPGPNGLTGLKGQDGKEGVQARDLEIAVNSVLSGPIAFTTAGGEGGQHGLNAPDIPGGPGGPPGDDQGRECPGAQHGPHGAPPVPLAQFDPSSQGRPKRAKSGRPANISTKGTTPISFDRQVHPTHDLTW